MDDNKEFAVVLASIVMVMVLIGALVFICAHYRYKSIEVIVNHAPQLTVDEAKDMLEIIERKH